MCLKYAVFHGWKLLSRSEKILRLATNISRDKLVSVGTCFGKFTKTLKFRLHITALDFLAPYAKVSLVKGMTYLHLMSCWCI